MKRAGGGARARARSEGRRARERLAAAAGACASASALAHTRSWWWCSAPAAPRPPPPPPQAGAAPLARWTSAIWGADHSIIAQRANLPSRRCVAQPSLPSVACLSPRRQAHAIPTAPRPHPPCSRSIAPYPFQAYKNFPPPLPASLPSPLLPPPPNRLVVVATMQAAAATRCSFAKSAVAKPAGRVSALRCTPTPPCPPLHLHRHPRSRCKGGRAHQAAALGTP